MLLSAIGVLFISSGALCAPSDAVEVGVCSGDGCSALKSSIGAIEMARKELGCCTHADCLPSVTTILCAHDVMTRFFQNSGTSKVCSDFNEQCEALRVVKMNLQLSSNILGCHEREERAFIHAPSASTRKVLEDLLPRSVVTAIHSVLPDTHRVIKVEEAVASAGALATGVVLAGGHSNNKGNVYFLNPATGLWGAVCADSFAINDAQTVCRQLGFRNVKEHYGRGPGANALLATVRGNQFGPVPDPFNILLGVAPFPVVPASVGANCPAPPPAPAPVVTPFSACGGFGAAIAVPVACPSQQVAGVVCEA